MLISVSEQQGSFRYRKSRWFYSRFQNRVDKNNKLRKVEWFLVYVHIHDLNSINKTDFKDRVLRLLVFYRDSNKSAPFFVNITSTILRNLIDFWIQFRIRWSSPLMWIVNIFCRSIMTCRTLLLKRWKF